MKRALIAILILVVVFVVWKLLIKSTPAVSNPKQQALKERRHSDEFNVGIDTMMAAYLEMKNDFVEADSIKAKEACKEMLTSISNLKLDELKKDTTGIFNAANIQIGDVRSSAESLLQQPNITEMRQDFKSVSDNIYPFLKTIHYEGKVLYLQNCPMAFGEDKDANWLSSTANIINPYLGKKNPQYHATMVGCGETKDSIQAQ
jgi:hypothetical protein